MTKRAILVLQMFNADMAFQTEIYSYHQLFSFVAIVRDVNGCIFPNIVGQLFQTVSKVSVIVFTQGILKTGLFRMKINI